MQIKVTVAIDKDRYFFQIYNILQDKNTYIEIQENPNKQIESNLNNMLKTFLNKNYRKKQYYYLRSTDRALPKAYGTPKIHKENYPLRIIVSSINSPLYNVSNFVHKILTDSLPQVRSYVKNSFSLYDSFSNLKIGDTDVLVSLDVVSLFTKVPLDMALAGINNRWSYIEKRTTISKNEFMNLISFILSST